MTDNAEGGSNSHAITPQEVDQEGGAIEGGGVRGRAIVSQIGSWKVMSTWASLARDTISDSFTT